MESGALLVANLERVRAQIRYAAQRCGRDPVDVTLLAVSKQQSIASIAALIDRGQRDFGENYLQEALDKVDSMRSAVLWHYIGQVQSNKTRPIAERFDWVHTVDRLKIAQRLNEQRPLDHPPLNICIQVKLADEAGKGGVPPDGALSLAAELVRLPRLRLRGLMCIPPPAELYEEQFTHFRRCADLLRSLNTAGLPQQLDTLSMGMTADLEAAIAAGATIVRIGTAIFGERQGAT